MYFLKQSSKSIRLWGLEHISKMAGADSSSYQTPSRWLLEKHTSEASHQRCSEGYMFTKSSKTF